MSKTKKYLIVGETFLSGLKKEMVGRRFDCISFPELSLSTLNKYKVVVIFSPPAKSSFHLYRYASIFCETTATIIISFFDIHEYTFDPSLLEKKSGTSLMFVPTHKKGLGIRHLKKKLFDIGKVYYAIVANAECEEWKEICNQIPLKMYEHIPMHIPVELFKDYKKEKKVDILFYGSSTILSYPFRERMLTQIFPQLRKKGYIVHTYKTWNNKPVAYEKLPSLINESWLTLATYSSYRYHVKRYWEIPACKSVVLGNLLPEYQDYWNNNYVSIDEEMSNDQIIENIESALADKEKLRNMADAMYEKVRSEYNMDQYVEKIHDFCQKVEKDTKEKQMITFLAGSDFANFLTELKTAINKYSKKYIAKIISFYPHPYQYVLKHDYDIKKCSKEVIEQEVKPWIEQSTIIISSNETFEKADIIDFNKILQLDCLDIHKSTEERNNHLYIFHPGSHYRYKWAQYNITDEKYFEKHLFSPDLYRLSPKTSKDFSVFPPVPLSNKSIEELIHLKFNRKKRIILHCPSNDWKKGTTLIDKAVRAVLAQEEFKDKYEYVRPNKMSYEELCQYKEEALFEIDQVQPNIGAIGMSALESCGKGTIVLSHFIRVISNSFQKAGIPKEHFPMIELGGHLKSVIFVLGKILQEPEKTLKYRCHQSYNFASCYLNREAIFQQFEKSILNS